MPGDSPGPSARPAPLPRAPAHPTSLSRPRQPAGPHPAAPSCGDSPEGEAGEAPGRTHSPAPPHDPPGLRRPPDKRRARLGPARPPYAGPAPSAHAPRPKLALLALGPSEKERGAPQRACAALPQPAAPTHAPAAQRPLPSLLFRLPAARPHRLQGMRRLRAAQARREGAGIGGVVGVRERARFYRFGAWL